MPSEEGRRSVVLRSLVRWHGRSTPERRPYTERRTSIVSAAAALAMVGAVALTPAILARTPIVDSAALGGRSAYRYDRQPGHAEVLNAGAETGAADVRPLPSPPTLLPQSMRSFPSEVRAATRPAGIALGMAALAALPSGAGALQARGTAQAFAVARDEAAKQAAARDAARTEAARQAEAARQTAAREAAAREAAAREAAAREAAAREAAAREAAREAEAARQAQAAERAQAARQAAEERAAERREQRERRQAAAQQRREREQRQRDRAPATGTGAWNIAPTVTWYGPGFYGNGTACGQRYSRTIIGVAHKTLPCGTLVEFRWRGITAVAPVIDRGPYAGPGYDFDFSAALACDVFKPRAVSNSCYTRHDVEWRIVGRRRN